MVGILVSDQRETSWKWSWPNWGTIPVFGWKNQRKPTSTSERATGVPVTSLWALSQPGRSTTSWYDYSVQLIICSSIQGTRRCVTLLTTPRHWTLFLVIYLQSTTPHVFRWSNYTTSCTYRLYRNRHFPFLLAGQNFWCISLYSTSATYPTNTVHLLWNALIILAKEYKLLTSL